MTRAACLDPVETGNVWAKLAALRPPASPGFFALSRVAVRDEIPAAPEMRCESSCPAPPWRLLRSVLPGGPGAHGGQQFPGALVVGGVQPQHVEQGLLGFLDAVQLPQREGHAVEGTQERPVVQVAPVQEAAERVRQRQLGDAHRGLVMAERGAQPRPPLALPGRRHPWRRRPVRCCQVQVVVAEVRPCVDVARLAADDAFQGAMVAGGVARGVTLVQGAVEREIPVGAVAGRVRVGQDAVGAGAGCCDALPPAGGGSVVAAGPGKKDEPVTVKAGDSVLYGKYAGTEFQINGEDLLILRESDILAVL